MQGARILNGLVYSLDDEGDSTPIYWMGIVLAAFVIHAIPLFFLDLQDSRGRAR